MKVEATTNQSYKLEELANNIYFNPAPTHTPALELVF
jgi:hypothetical protein